jgi:type II secretion system protein N
MRWDPSPRARLVIKAVGYPLFYLFALLLGARLSLPFDQIRQRVVAEFNARHAKDSGLRLEIDDLSGYWLFGVSAKGARLLAPGTGKEETKEPKASGPAPSGSAGQGEEADKTAEAKESHGKKLVEFDKLHVSVSPWRWLIGRVALSFGGKTLGGKLSGRFLDKRSLREVEVELEKVNLSQLGLLTEQLNVPVGGTVSGNVELDSPERKLAKAEGKMELTIDDFSVGDGKTKIRGALPLPKCNAGRLEIAAEVTDGKLKLTSFSAKGPDAEATAEGQIRLRDPFKSSQADLNLRYKFTERYMGKNDITKGLFGDPGSGQGGLMDLDPKVKKAKSPDGFYAWHVAGTLGSLGFQPGEAVSAASTRSKRPASK